ncbi:MAG: hypothetical protein AAGB26_10515 [Planctomycetota bacterium]
MLWMLAQLDREEALTKGYWNLAMIALVGLFAVIFLVAVFALRRWKRRQLQAIETDRSERRASKSKGRVDAWQASSERYIDHDKLAEEDGAFERNAKPGGQDLDEEDGPPPGSGDDTTQDQNQDEDEPDPYGLFTDKPYQDPDDEDDLDTDDEDNLGGWDEDEGPDDKP